MTISNTDTDVQTRQKTKKKSAGMVINDLPLIKLLKNISIGNRLLIGFGIMVIITILSAGLTYWGSTQATINIDRTEDLRVPTALASSRAQTDLLKMLGDVRGYLALGQAEYRDSYQKSREAFEADLAELDNLPLNDKDRNRLIELRVAFNEWSKLPNDLFELRDDQLEREPAYALLATDGTRAGGSTLIKLQSMIELQAERDPSKDNLDLLKDMANLQGSFTALLSGLRGYVTTRNRIYRQEYQANLDLNEFAWNRLESKQDLLTDNQKELLIGIAEGRNTFLSLPEQMFADLESDRWREDLFLFSTKAVPLAGEMQILLAEMTLDQQRLLKTDLNAGRRGLAAANQQTVIFGIIALIVGVGLAFIFRENIAGPVGRLTQVAESIRKGNLEEQALVESKDEIGVLAETFNNMTYQLRQTLQQVRKEKHRADSLLDVVIPIGVDLASEKDFNRLMEKMLLEAKTFCRADAGILYLRKEDYLGFVIVHNDSLKIAMGGTHKDVTYSQLQMPLSLYDKNTKEPNKSSIATYVALTGETLNIPEVNKIDDFEFDDFMVFGGKKRYDASSYLTIPLKNSKEQVIGVMQLINAQDSAKRVISFDENLQQMMESFSSLAVAALEAYIREQSLKQEIIQLRIEIDDARRSKEVDQIVDSDFFQDLKAKTRDLRRRARRSKDKPKNK